MSAMSAVLERPINEPDRDPSWIPPLENGDYLTRAEFERRYSAMPHLKKAELIEGVVYMPSPVSHLRHSKPHALIISWVGVYWDETPGVEGGDNGSVRLDTDNEPQPDAHLIVQPEFGGQVKFDEEGYIEGAPELIVEVAASSVSYDLRTKLPVYRRNEVQEYVVWRVNDRQIDWFIWNEGRYDRVEPDERGIFHSRVFPGLVLDSAAVLAGDMKCVSDTQRAALHAPEHVEFIGRLASAGQASKG